jgi:hypothetical protein
MVEVTTKVGLDVTEFLDIVIVGATETTGGLGKIIG